LVVGNGNGFGLADTVPVIPVPVKLTVCVGVDELSVIVSVPFRVPAAEGVKIIGIVQDWPADRKAYWHQVETYGPSAKSLPLIWNPVKESDWVAEPELDTTTLITWLCVFTVWAGNVSGLGGVGDTITACAEEIVALKFTVSI